MVESRWENRLRLSWIILGTGVVAVILRLVLSVLLNFPLPFEDADDYLFLGSALARGELYPLESTHPFMRPPLYPYLVAIIKRLFHGSFAVHAILNACLGGIATAFGAFIAARSTPHRDSLYTKIAALCVGTIMAVHPVILRFALSLQTEPLFIALNLLGLTALLLATERRGIGALALAGGGGLAFTAALLTRSSAVAVIGSVSAAIWFCARRRSLVAGFCLGLVLGLTPWSLSSYLRFGEVILGGSGFGYNVWLGSNLKGLPLLDGTAKTKKELAVLGYFDIQAKDRAEAISYLRKNYNYETLGPSARSRRWLNLAWKGIAAKPSTYLYFLWRKLVAWWKPWVNPIFHPPWQVVASGATSLIVWPLALLGFISTWKNRAQGAVWLPCFMIFVVVSQTFGHLLMGVTSRYRIGSIDFFLVLMSGSGFCLLLKCWRQCGAMVQTHDDLRI